ncbi:MAG: amino acid adenylation domain-containing protein [Melioribacteraceae bacterium]
MNELIDNYQNLSPEKQKLVRILLNEQGIDIDSKFILPQSREKKVFPMSYAQKRLWFLEKFEPENSIYIIPSGVKITGNVNTDYFVSAINEVVKRHEILRTKFIEIDGEGFQEIIDEVEVEAFKYDISGKSINVEVELNKIFETEFQKPFKLYEIPLFRIIIIKVTEKLNYLLIPMHHIISDNWSTGIFVKEIIQFYNNKVIGKDLSLDPMKIQYVDYTIWQNKWLLTEEFNKQKEYWISHLKGSSEILEIIPDKKRPSIQTYNGSFEIFSIDKRLSNELDSFCKRQDITIFILFLSAFQFVLSKYANQNDINIGIPIANRNRSEIENLIGFFINTLVMRGKIDYEKSIEDFIKETKRKSFEAYSNQDVPFEMIVDELKLVRDMSHTAMFQAMLVLNNAPSSKLEIEGLKIEPIEFDTGKTKFDLVLSFTPNKEEYKGKFEFNIDSFHRDTIKSIINNFKTVLNEFIINPNKRLKEISLLLQDETLNVAVKLGNPSERTINKKFIHEKFEEIVEKNFQKRAITSESGSITYGDLNKYANAIANRLFSKGLKLRETVGIFIDRKIEYIAAIIGVLKSGGTFVPLDITYPYERLKFIIEDAKINYIITIGDFIESKLPKVKEILNLNEIELSSNENNPKCKIFDNNSAYIIYTSGTSGLPKGVVVEHSKIAYHINQMISEFSVVHTDKYLQFAAFNFDASIEQIFVPLLSGAEIYLRENSYWLPSEFIDLVRTNNITIINPPTVYWNQIVAELKNHKHTDWGKLKTVIVGGEEMQVELLIKWQQYFKNNIKLINAYGPTETVITSAIFKTDEKIIEENFLHVPIGKCIGKREVFILDQFGNIVGEGIPGELCFSGEILAQGYFGNPVLTSEKFIPNRFSKNSGSRIYRTGDLVRYDKNGFIEYLGRIDTQIKIRGFRIELSEIEQVLLKHENVKNAAVKIFNDANDNSSLFAFITSDRKNEEFLFELKNYCKQHLPNYMVPNQIYYLDELPINANGKLDRNKLYIPDNYKFEISIEFVEPRNDLEKEICEIVADLLNIEKIGIYNSFFDLGGHSILAIKVLSKIKEKFGVEVQLKSLFENPTVSGLADAVLFEQTNLLDKDDLEDLLNEIDKIKN